MGINAHVQINKEWLEPAIIWFVIAAKKGEKKTVALHRIKKPIIDIEEMLKEHWHESESDNKSSTPPQLIIDHFSFEELHTVMVSFSGFLTS